MQRKGKAVESLGLCGGESGRVEWCGGLEAFGGVEISCTVKARSNSFRVRPGIGSSFTPGGARARPGRSVPSWAYDGIEPSSRSQPFPGLLHRDHLVCQTANHRGVSASRGRTSCSSRTSLDDCSVARLCTYLGVARRVESYAILFSRHADAVLLSRRVFTNTTHTATIRTSKNSFCIPLRPAAFSDSDNTAFSLPPLSDETKSGEDTFGVLGCVTSSSSPSTAGAADPAMPSVKGANQRFHRQTEGYV
jgi:hypothetical protein